MVHHHADGECVFRLDERSDSVFFGCFHPERFEFRQVLGDGIIQGNASFFDEHCNGHAAEAFGLRALHVDIVHRDRTLCCDIGISDAGIFLDAVFVEYADCARELSGLDKRSQCIFCKSCVGVFDFRMEREAREERHRCDEHHSVKKFH